MLFSDSYFSIKQAAEGRFSDRGSKFLAYIFPVCSEAEIRQHLSSLKKEHPSARHHCYAWRLGADKQAFRANDDGEPSNTAGKPILGQIQAADLTNVLIVVVRYFGGTLLGAGGLINAYRESAADAIKNSFIEEKFILFEYKIEFGFEDVSSVMHAIKEHDAKIQKQEYDTTNTLILLVKKKNSEEFEKQLGTLYRVKLTYLKTI